MYNFACWRLQPHDNLKAGCNSQSEGYQHRHINQLASLLIERKLPEHQPRDTGPKEGNNKGQVKYGNARFTDGENACSNQRSSQGKKKPHEADANIGTS